MEPSTKRGPLRTLASNATLAATALGDPRFGEDNHTTLRVYREARALTVPWLREVEEEMREGGVWGDDREGKIGAHGREKRAKANLLSRLGSVAWECIRMAGSTSGGSRRTRKDVLLQRMHVSVSRAVAEADGEIARLERLLEGTGLESAAPAVGLGVEGSSSSGPSRDAGDGLRPDHWNDTHENKRSQRSRRRKDAVLSDQDDRVPMHDPGDSAAATRKDQFPREATSKGSPSTSNFLGRKARSMASGSPMGGDTSSTLDRGRSYSISRNVRSSSGASQRRPRSQQWRLPLRSGAQGTRTSGTPQRHRGGRGARGEETMEPEDPPKKAASASGKNRARSIPTLVVSPPSLRVSSTDARGTGRNVGGSQTRSATRTAGGRSEDDLAPNLRQHSTSEYDALKVPHDWSRSHDKPGYGTTPETNPAYAWKPPDRDDDDEETASQWSRATRAPTMLPDMSTPMPVNLEEYSRDRSHDDDGVDSSSGHPVASSAKGILKPCKKLRKGED